MQQTASRFVLRLLTYLGFIHMIPGGYVSELGVDEQICLKMFIYRILFILP